MKNLDQEYPLGRDPFTLDCHHCGLKRSNISGAVLCRVCDAPGFAVAAHNAA